MIYMYLSLPTECIHSISSLGKTQIKIGYVYKCKLIKTNFCLKFFKLIKFVLKKLVIYK